MKKLLLSVCLLAATSLIATAQSGHNSFYVQYNLLGVGEYADYLDDIDSESEHLNGLSVGFNKAFPITSSVPLFVEVGAGLTYAWAKVVDDEDEKDCRFGCDDEYSYHQKATSHHLMVNIPVNLMYKFQIPNSSITLEPYVGLNVKTHILGQCKNKVKYDACCDDMEDLLEEEEEALEEYDKNYFNKKDMGSKKHVAKRVNIGWQIGANVDFGKAFVGISYGSDFNKFMENGSDDWKFSATNFTVGLRF